MAAYATIADLTKYGIASQAIAGMATSDLQAAIDSACEMADSYLRSRFELPLASWGLDLRTNVCRMAAYFALTTRGFSPDGIDESIRLGYEDARSWFKLISDGKVHPNVIDSDPGGPEGTSQDAPFVVQPQASSSGGIVAGTPRSRGWI